MFVLTLQYKKNRNVCTVLTIYKEEMSVLTTVNRKNKMSVLTIKQE